MTAIAQDSAVTAIQEDVAGYVQELGRDLIWGHRQSRRGPPASAWLSVYARSAKARSSASLHTRHLRRRCRVPPAGARLSYTPTSARGTRGTGIPAPASAHWS